MQRCNDDCIACEDTGATAHRCRVLGLCKRSVLLLELRCGSLGGSACTLSSFQVAVDRLILLLQKCNLRKNLLLWRYRRKFHRGRSKQTVCSTEKRSRRTAFELLAESEIRLEHQHHRVASRRTSQCCLISVMLSRLPVA